MSQAEGHVIARLAWGALIRGHVIDLEDWEDCLKPPFEPYVSKEPIGLVLRSDLMDSGLTLAEARRCADIIIERLNGAFAASRGMENVSFDCMVEVMNDGSHRRHFTLSAEVGAFRLKLRGTASVLGTDGALKNPQPPMPTVPQTWIAIADGDDLLADALTYYARGDDWFDIYKALECLILRFGPGERNFLAKHWADPSEVIRMKRTANSKRHASKRYDPPSNPMTRREGRLLLASLIQRAFNEGSASRTYVE